MGYKVEAGGIEPREEVTGRYEENDSENPYGTRVSDDSEE
jgi:hypothetical protein